MMKYLFFLGIIFIFSGCNGQEERNVEYQRYKNEFEENLTTHFPQTLSSETNLVVEGKNLTKNDVKLMLYEYDVDSKVFDSVSNTLRTKSIASYLSKDKCLLIVNRFETIDTYENMKDVVVKDTTKVEQDCYKGLYPIPNFIDYKSPDKNNDLKLDSDFELFVIDAKQGPVHGFALQPNKQMPHNWKNGYSKGIAINKYSKTIVYWLIIW